MSEPRPEKVAIVEEIRGRVETADAVMVTEYRGLTVDELAELRLSMRPSGGKYKVYKNTLAKRAIAESQPELAELLVGPTALAFVEETPEGESGDVVGVAKALKDFAKTSPELVVKGGLFEGNFVDPETLSALADIEPREVLLSKFAGLLAAPMQRMAGLLQAVPRDFAYGLKALIDAGGAPGAPESEAAPAAEEAPEVSTEEPAAEEAAEVTDSAATESAANETQETASADAEPTEES